jgi:hypothetical protein
MSTGEQPKAISKDKLCAHTQEFNCNFYTKDRKYTYEIPVKSALFPKPDSALRTVLEDINIRIAIYKALPSKTGVQNADYSLLGSFLIDVKTHKPERWRLLYDELTDTLAMDVTDDELPDSSLFESQVYSLVDFIPGAITATPDFYGHSFCADLMRQGVKDCATEVDLALIEGLMLDHLRLFFHYPKSILSETSSRMTCDYASRRFLTLWFSSDIEESASKLGVPSVGVSGSEKHNLCEAMRPYVLAWRQPSGQ